MDGQGTRAVGNGDCGRLSDRISDIPESKGGWRRAVCGVSRDNNGRINSAVDGCTKWVCLNRDGQPYYGRHNIQQSHPERVVRYLTARVWLVMINGERALV
jgi:hypothetical protein